MVAITATKLWSIDVSNGAATEISAFDGSSDLLISLAFVPFDSTNPAAGERLITAGSSGNVYEVNPLTGATTLLGNFGMSSGNQIHAGGDLLGIHGLGIFASVGIGEVPGDSDYFAVLNESTFAATPLASSTGFDRVLGLGFWNGIVYGLVDNGSGAGTGQLISINGASGAGTPLLGSSLRWFGAAVSTDTPIGAQ
jgi:hypothetical protein